eukprot:g16883.t1
MQMARMLQMACICLLTIFARAQELQDCSVVDNPFTVGSTEDASTLAASLRCSTGDFDVQWVGEVFVAETIHVTSGTSLTITGSGRDAIVDGRAATQLFVVDRGSSLHFSDMTFAHGNASFGGAINALEASVSFSGNASFISNAASVDGGAIFANRSTIFWDGDRTRFMLNSAGDDGGAIYSYESNVSWDGDGTQFISNFAGGDDGGAIAGFFSVLSWNGDATEFSNNSASGDGGAIYTWESTVSWDGDGTQFNSNSAGGAGGAISLVESSTVSWDGDGTRFSSNSAAEDGGAVYAQYSNVSWDGDGTFFSFNSAVGDSIVTTSGVGGAIYAAESSNVSWDGDGTEFSSNFANSRGGVVFAGESNVFWNGNDTLFTSNSGSTAGVIYAFHSFVSWNGVGTQIVSNSASNSAGAFYAYRSFVIWHGDGTKFVSNTAGGVAGAIYVHISSAVSWNGDGTQFIRNSAGEDGGAIHAFTGSTVSWNGDNTQFISNFANSTNHGGAISLVEFSAVFWDGDGTQFSSNVAGYNGGAISADYSTVSWDGDGTQFRNNSGSRGGAIFASDYSDVLWGGNGTEFSFNSARSDGGAIEAWRSNLTWDGDGTQFSSNVALSGGGAIHAFSAYLSLNGDDIQFSSNSAGNAGSAISTSSSILSWNGDGANFSSNSAIESVGGAMSWRASIVSWNGDGAEFTSNSAVTGGALNVYSSTELSWNGDGTVFSFNSANESGGAIAAASDVLWNGDDTHFSFNSAVQGGAMALSSSGNISLNGDSIHFSSNSAADNGGAIYAGGFSSLLVCNGNDIQFSSNSAHRGDGGAMYLGGGAVSLNAVQFSSNFAGDEGGAIFVAEGVTVLSDGNTTFSRNVAGENGGAIASFENDEVAPIFHGGTFIENSAGNGGALYFSFAIGFNFTNVIFQSNSASDGAGGAVAAYSTGSGDVPTAIFTRCKFSDNMSQTGGAIETLAGQLEFNSCIFEGNSADDIGGAMRIAGSSIVVRGCSFLSNSASIRGFAVAMDGSANTNMTASSFEGNELFCAADTYRKDTEKEEESTARYEVVSFDCPEWDECSGCSIATSNVVSTCEAPLEHSEATQPGTALETLNISDGYWRATNDSDLILACYNADACNGGQTGAEDFCAPGYTGPYCAVCETDYSPSLSYTCTRCSSSRRQGLMAATVVAALVVACVLVATVQYLVSTKQLEEGNAGCFRRKILRAIPLQGLKIIVVVWQILTQFADVASVTYPGAYRDFLSAIDVVNFDLGSALSAGCWWSNVDFHDRLLVNTLGPLVVVSLLGITYWIAMYRNNSITASGDAVVEQIRYRHQTVLLLVTFLVYSSVSSTVFQTFACETLDDGIEYLRADYTILCKDAKHKAFEVYAGIMFAVYPIGIPLLYAILLLQRRDVLANADVDKTRAQSISSLWEPYRPERFYYEVVECGRRIMLTGVLVFIFPNDAAQIAITMLLAFFFFMVFEMLRPYASESDMWPSKQIGSALFIIEDRNGLQDSIFYS